MEWFGFGPRASNGSIDSAPNDQWSASERALRVSQNDALQALLNAEIHKSGFLTSAGHKAIVQKFLHSDEVDKEMARARNEEMTKARDAKPQEGLFRRLVSSGSTTSSAGGANSLFRRLASSDSMASSTGSIIVVQEFPYNGEADQEMTNVSDAKPQEGLFRGLSSSGSTTGRTENGNSLFRGLASSDDTTSITGSGDSSRARRRGSRGIPRTLRRFSADLSMKIDFDPNIAPRRASQEGPLPSPAQGGTVEEETTGVGQCPRPLIVKTKPPANCEDEAPAPSRPDESWQSSKDASHDDVLDSLRRTYGSWRRSCDGPADLIDPWGPSESSERTGGDRSVRSDDDDECGWLPWPSEGKDDGPDGDVHIHGVLGELALAGGLNVV